MFKHSERYKIHRESVSDKKDYWNIVKFALSESDKGLRTVDGLAQETHLPEDVIRSVLHEHKDEVRTSYVTDSSGRVMYTLKSNAMRPREIWATIRGFATSEP